MSPLARPATFSGIVRPISRSSRAGSIPASCRSPSRQSHGVGTSLVLAKRLPSRSASRNPGLGVAPTSENGSRHTTSANAVSGDAASCSCAFMMRIGPIHIASTSPASSAASARPGPGDGNSSTSTPSCSYAPSACAA